MCFVKLLLLGYPFAGATVKFIRQKLMRGCLQMMFLILKVCPSPCSYWRCNEFGRDFSSKSSA